MNEPPAPREEEAIPLETGSSCLPFLDSNFPWEKFEHFFLRWFSCRPLLVVVRNGVTIASRVIAVERIGLPGENQHGLDLRAKMDNGETWVFQCKRVQEWTAVLTEIAISRAEEGCPEASEFFLLLACRPKGSAQNVIWTRPRWAMWDGEKVTHEFMQTTVAEAGMAIVRDCFGVWWVRRLYPSRNSPVLTVDDFFRAELAEGRVFHHRATYVGRSREITAIMTFCVGGPARVMVVSAGGGEGKSRLLLEVARQLSAGGARVVFLNPSYQEFPDEAADYLARQSDLVVIVDDAHRFGPSLNLAIRSLALNPTSHLLLATRPFAVESLESQALQHGYDSTQIAPAVHLSRWRDADLLALARETLGPEYALFAPGLKALADGSPLLIVLGGELVRRERSPALIQEHTDFRSRVFHSFREDFLNAQPASRREILERVMRVLSFTGSSPRSSEAVSCIGELLGAPAYVVAECIDAMLDAGLVRETHDGVRLTPDLFSDALVFDSCYDQAGRIHEFARVLLERLRVSDFPALVRNVAVADWRGRELRQSRESVFEPVWQQFRQSLETRGFFARSRSLEEWSAIAAFQPERTLALAQWAIETNTAADSDPLIRSSELDTHERVLLYIPGILKPVAAAHVQQVRTVLALLWRLAAIQRRDRDSLADPINAIGTIARPDVHGSIERMDAVLGWVESLLGNDSDVTRFRADTALLNDMIGPVFSRAMQHSYQEGRTIHYSAVRVSVERTQPLRERAFRIAERLIEGLDERLALAALQIAKRAIEHQMEVIGYHASDADEELWRPNRLLGLGLLRSVAQRLPTSAPVLQHVRQVLLHPVKYEHDTVFRTACAEALDDITDSFDLRLTRALVGRADDEYVHDRNEEFSIWYPKAKACWEEFQDKVIGEALEQYPTPAEIHTVLAQWHHRLDSLGFQAETGRFLRRLCHTRPDFASPLLALAEADTSSPLRWFFTPVIESIFTSDPPAYRRLVEHVGCDTQEDLAVGFLHRLRFRDRQEQLADFEKDTMRRLLSHESQRVRTKLLDLAADLPSSDDAFAVSLLCIFGPNSDAERRALLDALGSVAERRSGALSQEDVAAILSRVVPLPRTDEGSAERNLRRVSDCFPKEVYRFFRARAEFADNAGRPEFTGYYIVPLLHQPWQLRLEDEQEFVQCEVREIWQKSASDNGTWISLLRILIVGSGRHLPANLAELIEGSRNSEELERTASLISFERSTVAYQQPDLVRRFLVRSVELDCADAVRRELHNGARPGARGFSNGEMDDECRYALVLSEEAASKHQGDPTLESFYREIATAEQETVEFHRRWWKVEDDA